MVSDHEISTIVMLSELGEGKCPRYWDDDEIQYDHINVTYLLSESCPYYTRREFQVTNTKNQDRIRVTQLQYHGWPTVSGQVPEVTRGLIELVGQSGVTMSSSTPILVHCSQGTDRSSMFVALSILTIQLRTEKRVDVSTVTRKLRCQRMGCLDTFLQYEFLHRAIVNYVA
ncbi:tyrosine-protein phosphatase 69D-like [Arctopsyche grandis]|uniref:tyrosine-protein phosphatase 69D-like n=1 Tax=Arctopsyche grandis TaxID=121162 RepID=UPI00406D7A43